MKGALFILSITAGVSLLGTAGASPLTAPSFSSLGGGRMASADTTGRPTSIPARERTPGFAITNVGGELVLGERALKKADGAVIGPATAATMRTCFSRLIPKRPASEELEPPTTQHTEWETSLGWAIAWSKGEAELTGVTLVHREQLVEAVGGTSATLEWTDAWLDTRTGGIRQRASGSVPLTALGTAASVKVYAGRDERGDGKHRLHVVARLPDDSPSSIAHGEATRLDGGPQGEQWCGHHRGTASLGGLPNGSEAVTLEVNALLPEANPGDNRSELRLPAIAPGAPVRDVRTRRIVIHASLSQTSRDREPVVAITTAWRDPRDTLARVAIEEARIHPSQLGLEAPAGKLRRIRF